MRARIATLLAAAAVAGAAPGAAQTPLESLRYAPDVTVALSGTVVGHHQVAEDDLGGTVDLVATGAIPSTAIITAYDVLAGGDQLLAFDTDVALPGGLTARPGDVVRFDGAAFSLLFDAAAAGLPRGTLTDAVSAIGPDDLLLSFDVAVQLGTLAVGDRDVVRLQGGTPSLLFDGAAAGLAPGLDLDGLHCIPQNGHLLLSFDGSGAVGGVSFRANDVLEYAPGTGTWALAYDGQAAHAGWFAANLLDLAAVTQPPGAIVDPTIGAPATNPPGVNTVAPGSTRVSGQGTPRAKPGDICIQIYALGPDGQPQTLLGSGGTDADGNFVAADGSFGIPVAPPLNGGQRLVAVDVCADRTGAAVAIRVVPAPALSAALLAALALLLAAAGVRRLSIRR